MRQATCTATVSMDTPSGDNVVYASASSGPVDAIYKAIDHIMNAGTTLEDYRIDSVGGGTPLLPVRPFVSNGANIDFVY